MMSLLCKQQEGRHSRDCFCLKISAFDSQPCIERLYSVDSTGMNLESACTGELQLWGSGPYQHMFTPPNQDQLNL